MKKLFIMVLVSVFTLGACASSSDRETASADKSHHYVPVGLER